MPDKSPATDQALNTALARQPGFFNKLPLALQAEMAAHYKLEKWKKGSFVDPGWMMQRFYTVLEGQIEMKRSNPDNGREVTLDLLYPGDSFDVITLLDHQPHELQIIPLTRSQLMSVPIEMMRKWLWTYPEMNQQFLPYLARKMRDQENLSTSLALHDVTTRLSRIILNQINRISSYAGDQQQAYQHHLINGLSDEALARMVGSVRQVVNKQLQHWKSQDILQKKRNQLVIKDLDAIYRAANVTSSRLENPSENL
ncbi:MAG: Crp/Fnr family transcriptional regulator [Gammaproteobacteria bacterium]|nr:Crp/Fnr family transcriptional regulator [Gammaproteobacteria bacterium]MBL6998917.1 Crp/Fnr family transcriptional regulator [Gammaproteobacteria bacterium]